MVNNFFMMRSVHISSIMLLIKLASGWLRSLARALKSEMLP